MMSFSKNDLFALSLLFLTSILTVFDLFVNTGRPATMDGLTHITTIAQFSEALKSGDFPVRHLDGFANYGLPLGIIVHQVPSYLGGLINLIVNDPLLSFNLVSFLGILLSSIFFYFFLRIYSSPMVAFTGAFVFNLAPYRIINLYIRGAIPETFSAVFPPLILIGLYFLIKKNDPRAFFLLVLSFFGLMITHPMMLVVYSFLLFLYFLFLLYPFKLKEIIGKVILVEASFLLAFGMSSFYILPLLLETKYFYYGSEKSHLVLNQFMTLRNFFDPGWYYFTQSEIFTRGHIIKAGFLETIIFLGGFIISIWLRVKNGWKSSFTLLEYIILTGLALIFFMSEMSTFLFGLIPVLGNIQFPWRFFSAFMFLPPILIVLFLQRTKWQIFLIFLIISVFAFARFPELYGKNYALYPKSDYYFTNKNLHSTSLNTIWTGETESYPVKKEKVEIIGGEGTISNKKIFNSERSYTIDAKTTVRMIDNTFYFPGWRVFVDGQETPIEFQDSNHRGVITYSVPSGQHNVLVKFTDTKIRYLSNVISIAFMVLIVIVFLIRKKILKRFI